jgi:hypothetical protein
MGVIIPPILAPYAIASANLIFTCGFCVRKRAKGISKSVVVVFDKKELNTPEVILKEKIIPLGVAGKS